MSRCVNGALASRGQSTGYLASNKEWSVISRSARKKGGENHIIDEVQPSYHYMHQNQPNYARMLQ